MHPTINLISEPDKDCANSVYNCVEYCFQANDFQTQTGTKAEFTIEKDGAVTGYSPGIEFTIAGQVFTTGTTNTYNEVNTAPTQTDLEFVQNFQEALNSNQYLYQNFDITINGITLEATAREVGQFSNFTFDYSNFITPPINSDTQGTNDEYRPNYRLVLEIWECILGSTILDRLVSKEAYTPDKDGTLCINIGDKVNSLVGASFLLTNNQSVQGYADLNISKSLFVRYGESYSDILDECDVQLRHFENTDPISVINSAFQKKEVEEKLTYICEANFMTNTPDFIEICDNTETMLWIDLTDVLPDPPNINIQVRPYFEITYTDGTTSSASSANFFTNPSLSRQIFSVCAGASQVNGFATPGKVVAFYEVRIIRFTISPASTIFYGSQFFKRVSCCSGDVLFYFLNEYGGFDSILFSEVSAIDLEQNYGVFESFLDCDDETFDGGKDIIDHSARDIFTVTSKFPNEYKTRLWLREFLTSPIKYIKKTLEGEAEIFDKIIVVDASVQYVSNEDNFLLLRLQYYLNEDINLQKN